MLSPKVYSVQLSFNNRTPPTRCLLVVSWPFGVSLWFWHMFAQITSKPALHLLVVTSSGKLDVRRSLFELGASALEACLEFLFSTTCWLGMTTKRGSTLSPRQNPNVEVAELTSHEAEPCSRPRMPAHL